MDDINAIAAALRGRLFGTTRVLDGDASRGEDVDGDPAAYVNLLLTDPFDGSDTWPVNDVLALHRAARAIANDLDINMAVYLRLRPLTTAWEELL